MSANKDCKYCNKTGLRMLPLIYAALSSDKPDDLTALPALPEKLGAGVTDIKLGESSKYAVRILREGYLYVLLERAKIKYWTAYAILDDAFLYAFDAETPPQETKPFTCARSSCGIDASMIDIPNAKDVANAWLMFTPSPLTKAKLAEYKSNAETFAKQGKLQHFSPAGWLEGSTRQEHTLLAAEVAKTVPEYLLYGQSGVRSQSGLGELLTNQLFPACQDAVGLPLEGEKKVPNIRLEALNKDMVKKGYGAIALYDHIGIAQSLNDFRNDSFQPVDTFMGKKVGTNVDNTYRFDIYNAIGQLRTASEKGFLEDAQNSVELADAKRRAKVEPIFPDDSAQMRRFKMQANNPYTHPSRANWEAKNPDKVAMFEAGRERDEERLIESAEKRAAAEWEDVYLPLLDKKEMETFIGDFHKISNQARKDADARSPQHLSWLKSKQVLAAFDIYDPNNAPSGEALRGHVVGCIFGMEASKEAEAVLTDWAAATSITRQNLLMRAFTRDQDAVKKEADKALAEATALAAGMTQLAAAPATKWDKATKGLVSAIKSTDSALDEWMRNQGQSKNYLNPKHLANIEARFFYLVSTLTRSVARKGMGNKLDIAFATRANAIMTGFLGDLATEIDNQKLNLQIKPADWDDLKRKHANAEKLEKASASRKDAQQKRAYRQARKSKAALEMAAIDLITDAQLKAKLQLAQSAKRLGWSELQKQMEASAAQHANYKKEVDALKKNPLPQDRVPSTPSPTNNFHQVRIGGVLAAIETISLMGKANDLKGFDIALADLGASVFSLMSIGLDMMYAYTKSARELPHYNAIHGVEKGLDIVRGGFKLAAGLCAAFAGGLTAIVDWHAIDKSKDPIQRGILYSRFWVGVGNAAGGLTAAYSYAEPLLKHMAARKGRTFISHYALERAASGAFAISKRVPLLRGIAWLGWIGVAITVIDLSYSGYRWYMDATALRRWFERCLFRKVKSRQPYRDEQEELKELTKAQQPGQELEKPEAPRKASLADQIPY